MKKILLIIFHPVFFCILAILFIFMAFFSDLMHWQTNSEYFAQKAFLLFSLSVLFSLGENMFKQYPMLKKIIDKINKFTLKRFSSIFKKLYE